jgi:elongation factor G
MDHPKAGGGGGLSALLDELVDRWGRNCVPVQLPISGAEGFHGVVDLVTMEAFYYTSGGDGRGKVTAEIPASLTADAKTRHEALVELIAEGKDELMEEYFDTGTLTKEHLIAALHEAIREDRIFPVLFSSGLGNMALDHLLDFIKAYVPSPVERGTIAVRIPTIDATSIDAAPMADRKIADSEPLALMVFKTMTDPFSGRISFFKVISGVVKNDATVENYTRRDQERLSHLSVMQGRKAVEVPELHAGDLGAVAKLRVTLTGDTLGQKGSEVQIDLFPLPEPAMTYAIEPKSRADEDKLAPAIHKLMEEDLLIRFFRDPQTNEFLIAGAGQPHIEAIVSRLKKRYHAEVTLKAPKVPYRETIRAKVEAPGRHKKQTGGHGQFGDCKIRMEPQPRGAGFEFASEVFGGAIPRNFIPAIEKGHRRVRRPRLSRRLPGRRLQSHRLRRQLSRRGLQRNVLQDGRPNRLPQGHGNGQALPPRTHHEGRNRGPRRVRRNPDGRPQQPPRPRPGHGLQGPHNVNQRQCPHGRNADLWNAANISMTQGKGSYRMEMDHYDIVPQLVADKILANAKRPVEEEEE